MRNNNILSKFGGLPASYKYIKYISGAAGQTCDRNAHTLADVIEAARHTHQPVTHTRGASGMIESHRLQAAPPHLLSLGALAPAASAPYTGVVLENLRRPATHRKVERSPWVLCTAWRETSLQRHRSGAERPAHKHRINIVFSCSGGGSPEESMLRRPALPEKTGVFSCCILFRSRPLIVSVHNDVIYAER
jgi:hypothetical protein